MEKFILAALAAGVLGLVAVLVAPALGAEGPKKRGLPGALSALFVALAVLAIDAGNHYVTGAWPNWWANDSTDRVVPFTGIVLAAVLASRLAAKRLWVLTTLLLCAVGACAYFMLDVRLQSGWDERTLWSAVGGWAEASVLMVFAYKGFEKAKMPLVFVAGMAIVGFASARLLFLGSSAVLAQTGAGLGGVAIAMGVGLALRRKPVDLAPAVAIWAAMLSLNLGAGHGIASSSLWGSALLLAVLPLAGLGAFALRNKKTHVRYAVSAVLAMGAFGSAVAVSEAWLTSSPMADELDPYDYSDVEP